MSATPEDLLAPRSGGHRIEDVLEDTYPAYPQHSETLVYREWRTRQRLCRARCSAQP